MHIIILKIMLKKILALFAVSIFLLVPFVVRAAQYEDLANTPVAGDYVIGPGKSELLLDPGQSAVRNLVVTNRYGKDMGFKIEIEDFKGSKVVGENIVLLGAQKGPYSLKDFLHPETSDFVLKHGQRITIPITISIPVDAQPGGLYGSVIVTTKPIVTSTANSDQVAAGNVTVISRLASLFFVRVSGPVNESGQLQNFNSSKHFYPSSDFSFSTIYQNDGSVYLNPYGIIEIKNILGDKIDEIKVDPYFVMPDAVRQKDFKLSRGFMLGLYKANIMLNRGYGNMIDQKSISFWVLPWKAVVVLLLAITAVIFIINFIWSWFKRNFERKPKK